jgi:ectoine hydroxylase-related dioxygenase (phytanoyl-CoA dioxygenase family)
MNKHPLRAITQTDIETYARDGVVLIKNMLDDEWIERMRAAIDRAVAEPEAHGILSISHGPMTSICYMSRNIPAFLDFALESPIGEVVGRVIGADTIRFYHDHLFVKPPRSPKVMTWHCDETAWPVTGEMVPNIWTAFSPINGENGRIEYIAGFHRYCVDRNTHFGFTQDQADGVCPDFEAERDNPDFPFRFVTFDMEPGDAVIFHPLTPHFSKGNMSETEARVGLAVRVFGDDVRWWNPPYKAGIPGLEPQPDGLAPEGDLFPVLWRRAQN